MEQAHDVQRDDTLLERLVLEDGALKHLGRLAPPIEAAGDRVAEHLGAAETAERGPEAQVADIGDGEAESIALGGLAKKWPPTVSKSRSCAEAVVTGRRALRAAAASRWLRLRRRIRASLQGALCRCAYYR